MSLWNERPRCFLLKVPKWNVLIQFLFAHFCFHYFFDTSHTFWCICRFALPVAQMTKQISGKCCFHLPPRGPKMDNDMGLWQHQKNIVNSFFQHLTRTMMKFCHIQLTQRPMKFSCLLIFYKPVSKLANTSQLAYWKEKRKRQKKDQWAIFIYSINIYPRHTHV